MERTVYNSLYTLVRDTAVLRDYTHCCLDIIKVRGVCVCVCVCPWRHVRNPTRWNACFAQPRWRVTQRLCACVCVCRRMCAPQEAFQSAAKAYDTAPQTQQSTTNAAPYNPQPESKYESQLPTNERVSCGGAHPCLHSGLLCAMPVQHVGLYRGTKGLTICVRVCVPTGDSQGHWWSV